MQWNGARRSAKIFFSQSGSRFRRSSPNCSSGGQVSPPTLRRHVRSLDDLQVLRQRLLVEIVFFNDVGTRRATQARVLLGICQDADDLFGESRRIEKRGQETIDPIL